MGSKQPPTSSTDAEPILNFHQHFRQQVGAIQTEVEALTTPGLSASERKQSTDAAFSQIAKLSAELADASGELAAYDQRSYNQALKRVQDRLAAVQATITPKPKFSFKNKRLAGATSESNSTSTSRSVTPIHLKDPDASSVRGAPVPAIAGLAVPSQKQEDDTHGVSELDHGLTDLDSGTHQTIIHSLSDAYIQHPLALQVDGGLKNDDDNNHNDSCILSNITSSVINLGVSGAPATPFLTAKSIDSCFILAPNVDGPAHLTGLNSCAIILGCHQFRMHDSHNVKVWLFCSSRPIIENCSNISFAPAPQINGYEIKALDGNRINMYDQVDDFKWLRAEPSPNWRLMEIDEQQAQNEWNDTGRSIKAVEKTANDGKVTVPTIHGILQQAGVYRM